MLLANALACPRPCRQHAKAARKVDKLMGELVADAGAARREAQDRGARIAELEAALSEARAASEAAASAAAVEAAALRARAEALGAEAEGAAARHAAAVEAALAAAGERVELELRGQQLAYEGRIQVGTPPACGGRPCSDAPAREQALAVKAGSGFAAAACGSARSG
jgi:hypothetical protein